MKAESRRLTISLTLILALLSLAAIAWTAPLPMPPTLPPGFTPSRDSAIYVMDADGHNPKKIADIAGSTDEQPRWSPDGHSIMFEAGGQTYVVGADGNGLTKVPPDRGAGVTLGRDSIDDATWSPDGSRVAFVSTRSGRAEVYIADTDWTNVIPVTRSGSDRGTDMERSNSFIRNLTWSPDGSKLAFVWRVFESAQIEVINADGTDRHAVTNIPALEYRLAWSPDSSKVAYILSDNRGWNRDPFLTDADGTKLEHVADISASFNYPAMAPSLAWSPDGKRIVVAAYQDTVAKPGTESQLYVVNLSSGERVQLTANAGDNRFPQWSPDGETIAFTSNRNGENAQIFRMRYDGSSLHALTQSPGIEHFSLAWSPDGSKIAYAAYNPRAGETALSFAIFGFMAAFIALVVAVISAVTFVSCYAVRTVTRNI